MSEDNLEGHYAKIRSVLTNGRVQIREPLCKHTTMKVGGIADIFIVPDDLEEFKAVYNYLHQKKLKPFILGGGANIVPADKGIRGVVLSTERLNHVTVRDDTVTAGGGFPIGDLPAIALEKGLCGLEFITAMPGSVGGAVVMNARCYGSEIADILEQVLFLTPKGIVEKYLFYKEDWGYKRSPFQSAKGIIIEATFRLQFDDTKAASLRMEEVREDRKEKGHFRYPSAGSVFKNNRLFGKPSGKIIDELGLRGERIGGAVVAPWHGNIIINEGNASACDIYCLVDLIQQRSLKAGYPLEPEILFVGEW